MREQMLVRNGNRYATALSVFFTRSFSLSLATLAISHSRGIDILHARSVGTLSSLCRQTLAVHFLVETLRMALPRFITTKSFHSSNSENATIRNYKSEYFT